MGIQGSGALLFSDRANPRPLLFGGTGSESYSPAMPDFYPDALEAGTLSFPAVVSLLEGVRYLSAKGKEIPRALLSLTEYLIRKLSALPGCKVYSAPNACGIVAFSLRGLPSEYLAGRLSEEYSVAVRGGLHCAPLMHRALGTKEDGLVRVSFSHFSRRAEADILADALRSF